MGPADRAVLVVPVVLGVGDSENRFAEPMFEETLRKAALEAWATELEVGNQYERLTER